MRKLHGAALAFFLLIPAGSARAVPLVVALTPANAAIHLRAFAFSLLPVDGGFTHFSGRLAYDPARPGFCRVKIAVAVASLHLASAAMTADVLSPRFLNAEAYPRLHFAGTCQGNQITGLLDMHGVSRAFDMHIRAEYRDFVAIGWLRRALWGITGRPTLAGPLVRIRVAVRLGP